MTDEVIKQVAVTCPRCGCFSTHLERVVVSQGDYTTIVDSENDRLIPHSQRPDRTGSVVDVYLWCSNGHTFIVSLEYIGGGVLSTMTVSDDFEGEMPELWRED